MADRDLLLGAVLTAVLAGCGTGGGAGDGADTAGLDTDPVATTEPTTSPRSVPTIQLPPPSASDTPTPTPSASPTPTATPTTAVAEVRILSDHPDAEAIGAVLGAWAEGITTQNLDLSWAQYTAGLQSRVGYERFVTGNATSVISDPVVRSVADDSAGRAATIAFRSTQDPSQGFEGQECSDWQLRWSLVPGPGGGWLVDAATPTQNPAAC